MNGSRFAVVLLLAVSRSSFVHASDTSIETPDPEARECILPAFPQNGSYTFPKCKGSNTSQSHCSGTPGTSVPPYWLLAYTCHQGYHLPQELQVYHSRCLHGLWAPIPPVCLDERITNFVSDAYKPKSTSKPVPGGCVLPRPPQHGHYFAFCTGSSQSDPGCANIPGTPVPPGWTITYSCDSGYSKMMRDGRSSQYARCTDGNWDMKPPLCIKQCPPLESKNQEFRCFHESEEVDCSKPMMPGTIASHRCRMQVWSRDPHDSAHLPACTAEGEWTYLPPPCQPTCGMSLINGSNPRIIDGDPSPLGNFPWHAGIYHRKPIDGGWEQFCGGSLIRPNVIVTAAYCVVKEGKDRSIQLIDPKNIRVALGKYYRDWNRSETTEIKREVIKVKVPSDYRGTSTNFEFDIALLLLSEDVPLSATVMTVCLNSSAVQHRTNNMLGYITGWGNSEHLEPSDTVLYCSWPFQDYQSCFYNLVKNKKGYISADKFCAGVEVRAAARKSIGGSFSFVVNNKHYISGILSSQVVRRDEVEYLRDISYPVFTNITHPTHQRWIEETICEWALPDMSHKSLFQPDCSIFK
uniref:Peptidase S1 domain-containing protein n=1 Tax=Cuerna arida TaxID=1464854 RepID=A0A1B6F5E2_9HEMI